MRADAFTCHKPSCRKASYRARTRLDADASVVNVCPTSVRLPESGNELAAPSIKDLCPAGSGFIWAFEFDRDAVTA
jgi:hypothetical protein